MTNSHKRGMMPKIVDKIKKRYDIASSATELFLEKGYTKLTINEIAKNAGIAKGSIYKYFDSKEDIVFAIIQETQESYDKEIMDKINSSKTIEEKILSLFDLCISTTNTGIRRRKMYKEFITICLNKSSDKMVDFLYEIRKNYIFLLNNIINTGINKGELKSDAIKFVDGLFAAGESILLFSSLEEYNDKVLFETYIKSLLALLKTNKKIEKGNNV
jgi:AcrR family transcriptional regulator